MTFVDHNDTLTYDWMYKVCRPADTATIVKAQTMPVIDAAHYLLGFRVGIAARFNVAPKVGVIIGYLPTDNKTWLVCAVADTQHGHDGKLFKNAVVRLISIINVRLWFVGLDELNVDFT